MNLYNTKLTDILIDLKENHHVVGIKAEFETEGTCFDEALLLKKIVANAGLDLTIKIGGCEAVKDIREAKIIGANTIVAPMIESPYAVKKFINAIQNAFSFEERNKMNFFINIETISGFQCLEEILQLENSKELNGIVFGRTDMCGSLNLNTTRVNDNIILDYGIAISKLSKKYNKEFIIGGGITVEALEFFRKFPNDIIDKFETRKVIFDAKKAVYDPNTDKGILKALAFEIMWIKNKQECYGLKNKVDEQRLTMLNKRYNQLFQKSGIYAK